MTKTVKHKNSNNKTKKCPIGLKPFMDNYISKNKYLLTKSNNEIEQQFIKELLSKFAPHSIKPTDDFYDYINYQWLKNITLEEQQKYIVQIDDFRLAQDKVYHELDGIILDYIKNNNNKLATNLKNFYESVIEMNPIDDSKKLAIDAVETITSYFQENNAWKLLAFMNSAEMISSGSPFVWSINPDDKQPDTFRCYIDPHIFFLVDLNVYYDDGTDVK